MFLQLQSTVVNRTYIDKSIMKKAHEHYLHFRLWTAVDSCVSAEIENFISLH